MGMPGRRQAMECETGPADWADLGSRILRVAALATAVHMAEQAEGIARKSACRSRGPGFAFRAPLTQEVPQDSPSSSKAFQIEPSRAGGSAIAGETSNATRVEIRDREVAGLTE